MLKRASAVMGVVVMLPIAFMLATGALSASDAGTRAMITLFVVLGIRRLLGFLVFLDPAPRPARAGTAGEAEPVPAAGRTEEAGTMTADAAADS